jgi:hypothetical protein
MTKAYWIGNNVDGSGHGQIEVMSKYITKGTEGPNEKPVSIVGAPTKIRIECLWNASLQCYV